METPDNHLEQVEFGLLENGLDFILRALEYLKAGHSDRDIKYATLHLSSGIELVFKERIRRENWKLLFQNLNHINREIYESGDFRSVGIITSLDRLEEDCGVEFEEKDKTLILNFRSRRNKIEHLRVSDTYVAMVSAMVKLLTLLLEFIGDHLPNITDKEAEILNDIRKKLGDFEAFHEERLSEIETELLQEEFIETCPKCINDSLVIQAKEWDGMPRCLYCGYTDSSSEVAEEYIHKILGLSWRHIADGGEWPLFECPNCESEALVIFSDQEKQICFSCAHNYEIGDLVHCGSCHRIMFKRDLAVCDECFNHAMKKG